MWLAKLEIHKVEHNHQVQDQIEKIALAGVKTGQLDAVIDHLKTSLEVLIGKFQSSLEDLEGKRYSEDTWTVAYQPRGLTLAAWTVRLQMGAEEAIKLAFPGLTTCPVKITCKPAYDKLRAGYESYNLEYVIGKSATRSKKDEVSVSVSSKLVWRFIQADPSEALINEVDQAHRSNQNSSERSEPLGTGVDAASKEDDLTEEIPDLYSTERTDYLADSTSGTTTERSKYE
ncbi:hypothetical protein FFLO_04616 [Filobasidium floriforme]|uniref:Uncharacterized protein n=1 Tax=Filobasidium floriforme TaxID=5210 RepID=A0A8K0NP20_9TREE|nr:hypothetical protein FFLO_04616 [Filobasidium floriforme]